MTEHAWVSSGECRCGARFATRRALMVHLRGNADRMEAERDAFRHQVEVLREALQKYGEHSSVCGYWDEVGVCDPNDCTCGLTAARAALAAGEATTDE